MAQTNRFVCPSRASSVSRMHYKTKLIWISIVVSSTLQAFIYINLSKPNISPVIHDEANPQKHQRNVNFANTIEQTCSNNTPSLPHVRQSSTVSNPLTGSIARSILPPNQYDAIYQSCYFIPTSPKNQYKHLPLLQYYPNSYLVVTSEDEVEPVRLDMETNTIYIHGTDVYELLWMKTAALWNYVSTEINSSTFQGCRWFFKVDTDTFLNLHVIEQLLKQYSHEENHYLGWFAGRGGRTYKAVRVNVGIGAFYGFSRSVMQNWNLWDSDQRFAWGQPTDHTGEDSQVAFFLNEHGVCLDVPAIDLYSVRRRSGVWGVGADYFKDACSKKLQDLVNNYCFAYAHKVSLDWMQVLADVMAIHVAKQTKCDHYGKGVSRVVNGTIAYHRVEGKMQCMVSECHPCLRDAVTNQCCGWQLAE